MKLFPLNEDEQNKSMELLQDAIKETKKQLQIEKIKNLLSIYPDYIDARIQLIYLQSSLRIEANLKQLVQDYEQCLKEAHLFDENAGGFSLVEETKRYIDINYYLFDYYVQNEKLTQALIVGEKMLNLDFPDNYCIRYTILEIYLKRKEFDKFITLRKSFGEDISAHMLLIDFTYAYMQKNQANMKEISLIIDEYHPSIKKIIKGEEKLTDEMILKFLSYVTSSFGSLQEAVIALDSFQRILYKYYNDISKNLIN